MARPTSETFERFYAAHTNWRSVADDYRNFGASDTEPRWRYSGIVARAMEGHDVVVPESAGGWELYSDMDGSAKAAEALTEALKAVLAVIDTLGPRAVREIDSYFGGEYDM